MVLAPSLLEILRCPESQGELLYFPEGDDGGFLLCPASRLRYRIEGDIPIMLADDAERLDQDTVDELVAKRGQPSLDPS